MEGKSSLDHLKGVRLRIYCYLLQQNRPVGVRETQRALRLKSASHAAYHLQKLYEEDIVEKTPQNTYFLKEQYRANSIKVNVLVEYFLFAGRFWPRSVFYTTFLVLSLIIALLLFIFHQYYSLLIYLVLAIIATTMFAIIDVIKQMRALPWEENEE